jgi:ATP-binding cassette subfamily C protein
MRESQGVEAQGNFAATALRLIGGSRPLLAAAICTAGVNVLALTGPAYMLLLHDRVLPAHAGAQLLTLTLGMLLFYGLGARVDLARHKIFAACARRADRRLSRQLVKRMRPIAVRDLDRVRAFLSGQAPAALCDLPWMPLYLGSSFGLLASMGAASLIATALIADHRSAVPARAAAQLASIRRQPKHAAPGWCSTRGCVTRRMRRRDPPSSPPHCSARCGRRCNRHCSASAPILS